MRDLTTNEVLMFQVERWLSRQQEDCDVWRELPVVRPGKAPLQGKYVKITYKTQLTSFFPISKICNIS